MYDILTYALIAISVILIILVIMQPSKGNAASLLTGADDGQPKSKARGFEAFLIRATTVFGVLFFVLSLALAYLSAQ
ncbi:preprotein translocase subunit SecG [Aerococcaceae bacterium DSM 111176]|nr:preprotein translocase subunit SecG [Aerococcaceae bacterium DSM 111176]